eukprot:scaffold946_cov415-Prasinococcus_capsulatus_cf.AAC.2
MRRLGGQFDRMYLAQGRALLLLGAEAARRVARLIDELPIHVNVGSGVDPGPCDCDVSPLPDFPYGQFLAPQASSSGVLLDNFAEKVSKRALKPVVQVGIAQQQARCAASGFNTHGSGTALASPGRIYTKAERGSMNWPGFFSDGA